MDTSFSLPNSFCSSAPWYERKKGALSLDIDSLGESKLAHVRTLAYAQKSRLWTQLLLAFSKEMKSGTSNYSLRLTSTRIHSRCCTCSALSLTVSTIHSLSLVECYTVQYHHFSGAQSSTNSGCSSKLFRLAPPGKSRFADRKIRKSGCSARQDYKQPLVRLYVISGVP